MKHFIGLDVSMKETSICIVDEQGKVVSEFCRPTDPNLIATALKETQLLIEKVGVESGALSHWLTTQLRSLGIPAICVDARQMSALLSMKINKTDKNDARVIANAVRTMMYQEVKLKSQSDIELSTLLVARLTLVNQRTALKNTVRGMLKTYGIQIGTVGKKSFVDAVKKAIQQKTPLVQNSFAAVLLVYGALETQIRQLDLRLELIAKEDEDAQLLMTIPGIGVITALNFKVTIGDAQRFSSSKKVGAYVGMTPKQYSSGEVERRGRISKCGCREMRSLLVEAATVMLTRTKSWSKLKAWGLKLAHKKGMKKAFVAVGRKLAVIMHRMLITRKEFMLSVEKAREQKKQQVA